MQRSIFKATLIKSIAVYASLFSAGLMSPIVLADIFVCKDNKNHITYQEEPCPTKMVRTLKRAPEVPLAEQQKARERTEKANASYEAYAAKTEIERLQEEKIALERENIALEQQARQLKNSEYAPQPIFINPHGFNNRYLLGNKPFGFKNNQFNSRYNGNPNHQQNNGRVYNNDGFRLRLQSGTPNRAGTNYRKND